MVLLRSLQYAWFLDPLQDNTADLWIAREMVVAVAVDVFPCCGGTESQLIRRDSQDVAVDGMEVANPVVDVSSELGDVPREMRGSPENWTGEFCQGMEVEVVDEATEY